MRVADLGPGSGRTSKLSTFEAGSSESGTLYLMQYFLRVDINAFDLFLTCLGSWIAINVINDSHKICT